MNPNELHISLTAKGFVQQSDGSYLKGSRTNLHHHPARSVAKLERDPGDGALGSLQIQRPTRGDFLVRVTSYRKRLLDYDNLCEKYHIDLLRYAGIIPGDSPATTKIEVCQQKVEAGAREEIRIEIFRI